VPVFNIKSLNDIVDTLKLQFYPNSNITLEEQTSFNKTVESLVEQKKEAMMIKNADNQKRFIKTNLANTTFKVMASSQNSFNVVLQNGDISISFLQMSTSHSNPVVKVEFRAEFLLRFGYIDAIKQVNEIVSQLFDNYLVKVSEIHLAKDIQGYEFSTFDFHRMKTLSKSKTIFHNDISSEFYFGNRFSGFSIGKGDELLRVYNKTLEIAQNKQKAFIDVLSWSYNPDFDETKNVWRLEFQLRRARLKELLGNDGLLDSLENVINSISNLWAYCLDKFQHKDLTPLQLQEQIQGFRIKKDGTLKYLAPSTLRDRFNKAKLSSVWIAIKPFNGNISPKLQRVKDIKKPEVVYVQNAYKAILSTFIKLKRGAFNASELTEILLEADRECKDKHGVSLVDKSRMNALDYIVDASVFYEDNGIIADGFHGYKMDFENNIKDTFSLLECEPSNLLTFEQFQKRFHKLDDLNNIKKLRKLKLLKKLKKRENKGK
jgi:hypothetical protein